MMGRGGGVVHECVCMGEYTLLKDLSLSTQRQKTDGRVMFSLDLVSSGKLSPCAMKDGSKRKRGMD